MKYLESEQATNYRLLLTRSDLKQLGIVVSNTTLLRWEIDGKFPKRVRLGGTTVVWVHREIMNWITARKAERAKHKSADPRD